MAAYGGNSARSLLPRGADSYLDAYKRRKLPVVDTTEIKRRHKCSEEGRSEWLSELDEAEDYSLPMKRARRHRRHDRIFDSTAPTATLNFASELQSAVIPPFRTWAVLRAGIDVPESQRPLVNRELNHETHRIFEAINRSNLATEGHESVLDLAAGTGVLLCQPTGDSYRPVRFFAVPPRECSFNDGPTGEVEDVFRRWEIPAEHIKRKWPDANCPISQQLMQALRDKPHQMFRICEATTFDSKFRLFRYSIHLEQDDWKPVVDRELGWSPWIVHRFWKRSGDTYARGPLQTAMPDIRTANKVMELLLRNAALSVSGVWKGTDDGIFNPYSVAFVPGAVIPMRNLDALQPLERNTDFDLSQFIFKEMRASIRENLFNDDLPPADQPQPRSATELMIKQQRLVRKIGSSFGRLQNELVFPIVQKVHQILKDGGMAADIDIDGREIDVQFVSPLAQAQDQQDIAVLQAFLDALQAVGPAVMMGTVKVEDLPEYMANKFGIPSELIRTKDEREQMKAAAGNVMAQQQGVDQGMVQDALSPQIPTTSGTGASLPGTTSLPTNTPPQQFTQ